MELIILRSSAILELKVCCLIIQFPFEAGFERSTGQRVARLLAYAEGRKYHERKWSECYFMWFLYQPVQTRNKNKSSKVIINNCCPNTKIRNISPSLHIVSFIGAHMLPSESTRWRHLRKWCHMQTCNSDTTQIEYWALEDSIIIVIIILIQTAPRQTPWKCHFHIHPDLSTDLNLITQTTRGLYLGLFWPLSTCKSVRCLLHVVLKHLLTKLEAVLTLNIRSF